MGPIVHLSVMKQVKKLLSTQGINIDAGNLINVLEPDLTKEHDNWKNRINIHFESIKAKLKEGKDISRDVRLIAHFIIDHFAFTQSFSQEYEKNSDSKIDFYAEFVINKDKYKPYIKIYNDKNEIMKQLEISIVNMKNLYSNSFKKSWFKFLVSGNFREFVRRSIQESVEFTAAYVILAKNN